MDHHLKRIHENLPEGLADAPRQSAGEGGALLRADSQVAAGEVAFSNLNRVRASISEL